MFSYADDTTLIVTASTLKAAITSANNDLSKLDQWFQENRIKLNFSKSNAILFQSQNSKLALRNDSIIINNIPISNVDQEPLLGLQITSSLAWNIHIDKICLKLSFINSILFKLKMNGLPSKCILRVYKTLFLPYINYCAVVWGFTTKGNLNRLQVLQNKAIRITFGLKKRQNLDRIFSNYKLFKIRQLIHRLSCMFIHQDVLYSQADSPFHQVFRYSNYTNHSTISQDNKKLFLPSVTTASRHSTISSKIYSFTMGCPLSFAHYHIMV